jgi:hypothetical protein
MTRGRNNRPRRYKQRAAKPVTARVIRRDPVDYRKIGRAVLAAMAHAQREAEAQADYAKRQSSSGVSND